VIIIKTFNVSIIETVGFTIDVEAESEELAEIKAKNIYKVDKNIGDVKRELLKVEYIAD